MLAWMTLVQDNAAAAEAMTAQQFAQEAVIYAVGLLFVGGLAAVTHYKLLQPALPHPHLSAARRYPVWRQLVDGLAAAWLPLLLIVAPVWLAGAYSPAGQGYASFGPPLVTGPPLSGEQIWGFFGVQSSFEEVLFRGLGLALFAWLLAWLIRLLSSLTETNADSPVVPVQGQQQNQLWFYTGLAANIVVSVGFASVHAENMHSSGHALLNIALAGLALGQLYWLQGSLWGACVMHAAWNATMASLGLPVSGYLLRGPLVGDIHGAVPGLLTGGAFGPEGSLPCTFALLALWLWLVWQCWRVAVREAGAAPGPEGYGGLVEG